MNFTITAELEGSLERSALRAALDRLQGRHPLLGARFAVDDRGVRFESVASSPIALTDASHTDWKDAVEREVNRAFAPGEAPLVRALRIETRDSTFIALTFHHAIADGRSGVALMAELVDDALGFPSASMQPKEPSPPLHSCFPEALRWPERPLEAKALGERIRARLSRFGTLARWPWLDQPPGPGVTRFERIELGARLTAALVERSRREGTTMHGAVGAAHLIAALDLLPPGQPEALQLTTPVDLRPGLEPAMPVDRPGLGISMVWTAHRVSHDAGFWALAREVRDDVRREVAEGAAHLFYTRQKIERVPPTQEGVALFRHRVMAAPHACVLSNLGPISTFGNNRVRRISFAVRPLPTQLMFLIPQAFAGHLAMDLAYDAARVPREVMLTLASRILDRLTAEGGL